MTVPAFVWISASSIQFPKIIYFYFPIIVPYKNKLVIKILNTSSKPLLNLLSHIRPVTKYNLRMT